MSSCWTDIIFKTENEGILYSLNDEQFDIGMDS